VPELLWDASALVKRYYAEAGSASVDALFDNIPPSQMMATYWGYLETHAAIVRKRNRGDISYSAYRTTVTSLRAEVLRAPDFRLLTIEDADVLGGVSFVDQHSLNSADAAILVTFLRYVDAQAPDAPTAVLVATDTYLLRAADAEGLPTLNPQAVTVADIPALLARL
jgi:predicted nucleic acid-binding protein